MLPAVTITRPGPGGAAATVARPAADLRRLLEIVRRQLEVPIAFLTRIEGDDYVLHRISGDTSALGIVEGDRLPLGGTHCQRMLDGRIDALVCDLLSNPHTSDLDVTVALGLSAYAGVPVHDEAGELYGTLCAVDHVARPDLGAREVDLMAFLSELATERLGREADPA